MTLLLTRLRVAARRDEGFTMIAAIMILLVSSLLVTVTLVSAGGDIALTHNSTLQKKAYYAAMAGLSAYKYNLNTSPSETYWTECPSISEKPVAGTSDEHYSVITMASEKHTQAECKTGKQTAIIETSGSANGTFRIESTGTAGTGSEKATRKLVATFSHPGFLNYVYLTNYEILDPAALTNDPPDCEYYYSERKAKGLLGNPPGGCGNIEFASEDEINGPMHTNDAAEVCGGYRSKPTFGREGHHDKIEMNGGHYAASGCNNEINLLGEFTEEGPKLTPPATDTELLEAADDKFVGRTEIELKATNPNTLQRTNNKGEKLPVEYFPANGVIYVENEGGCSVKYSPYGTDVDYETDQTCGNAYVHGEYTEGLTIAAQNDIVINGNLKTKAEPEGKPIGEGRLGLIATNFVRVYHPVRKGYTGTSKTPGHEAAGGPYGESCATAPTVTANLTIGKKAISNILPSTAGRNVGEEVSGTGIASGTTIEAVKSSSVITLSKNATSSQTSTTLTFSRSGALKANKTEVTISPSTTGLTEGEEVSGAGIPHGTTIKIKSSTVIVLSNKATETATHPLTFYKPTGYEYYAGQGTYSCVEKASPGYEYHETEQLDWTKCESGSEYKSKGFCEYENNFEGCSSKAENQLSEPVSTIDAAILSTAHSFIVDNFMCGKHLGELTVWGAIAQFWRGTVGEGVHGYVKNYNYDERLAYLQPPDFLSPTSSQLKLDRITAASS